MAHFTNEVVAQEARDGGYGCCFTVGVEHEYVDGEGRTAGRRRAIRDAQAGTAQADLVEGGPGRSQGGKPDRHVHVADIDGPETPGHVFAEGS